MPLFSRQQSGGARPEAPDGLPVLSRGRHRSPRRGACFMELASYLAGERWSDHPKCTQPLLADLARQVNDWTPDSHRSPLAVLIPAVIGTSTDDPRADPLIALVCARAALPVVSAERQNVMAVGVVMSERVLAELEGRPMALSDESRRLLAGTPVAERYAGRYTADAVVTPAAFSRHGAPHVIRLAVQGISAACVPEPYELLRAMLVEAIRVCPSPAGRDVATLDDAAWARACALTTNG